MLYLVLLQTRRVLMVVVMVEAAWRQTYSEQSQLLQPQSPVRADW